MWPGFRSRRRRNMWVEFVVGSLLCSERFFSGYSGFPLSWKTNSSKFQFDQESGRRRTTLWMCYLQIIIYLFIYLIIYFLPSSSPFLVPRFSNIHLWMPCVPRQPMWLVTIQSTLTKYFWLRFCAASYRWFIIRFWETAHLPLPYRSSLKWHPPLRPIPNRLASRWGLGRRDGYHLRLLSFIMLPVAFHVGTRSHSV